MSHRPVIDGLEFARTGALLRGEFPVADMPRLRSSVHSDQAILAYELRGVPEVRGKPALKLKIDGTLQLACQRCLEAMDWPLRAAATLELAPSEAALEGEPLEAEGPEVVVAGKEMPVLELVEDEVLLALPLAPRHERCAAGAAAKAPERASPFARLRGMVDESKH